METTLLHNIAYYLVIGLVWGIFIEYIESVQTKRHIPKTLIARTVIVITWPIAVFIMLVGMIRNLITGK